MKVNNTTEWRTEDIRAVIKAAAEHRGYDVSDHEFNVQTCRARYKWCRPAGHFYSGRATIGGARPGRRDVHLGLPPTVHYRSDVDGGTERGLDDFKVHEVLDRGLDLGYTLKCRLCGQKVYFEVDVKKFDGFDAVEQKNKAEEADLETVRAKSDDDIAHSCKRVDVDFDVERFAQVVLHELDHSCQGLRHDDMPPSSELDTPFVDGHTVKKT